MPNIHILCIGKMKRGAMQDALAEYQKRLRWPVTIREFDLKDSNPQKLQEKESAALIAAIPKQARVIALDERGKDLSSAELAKKISGWQESESAPLAFLIGGADGHCEAVRKKADFLLSFGRMTWPHMLARVMLMEQLYRAQQILAGHPYHRE